MNTKAIIKKQIEQLPGIESVELGCVEPETPDHTLFHVYFDPESIMDRLTPEEVQMRNYKATERRGLINKDTTTVDFIDKITEETNEMYQSWANYQFDHLSGMFDPSELADIVIVCESMALHYSIDLQA